MENAVRQKRKRLQLAASKRNSPLIRRAVLFSGNNSNILILCPLTINPRFKAIPQTETKRYFRDVRVGVNPFQNHQCDGTDFAM